MTRKLARHLAIRPRRPFLSRRLARAPGSARRVRGALRTPSGLRARARARLGPLALGACPPRDPAGPRPARLRRGSDENDQTTRVLDFGAWIVVCGVVGRRLGRAGWTGGGRGLAVGRRCGPGGGLRSICGGGARVGGDREAPSVLPGPEEPGERLRVHLRHVDRDARRGRDPGRGPPALSRARFPDPRRRGQSRSALSLHAGSRRRDLSHLGNAREAARPRVPALRRRALAQERRAIGVDTPLQGHRARRRGPLRGLPVPRRSASAIGSRTRRTRRS